MLPFNIDPEELHQFPDRLFRRLLQTPANLRETIADLDPLLASRLQFDAMRLWHIFEDWRRLERDLPVLIPFHRRSRSTSANLHIAGTSKSA